MHASIAVLLTLTHTSLAAAADPDDPCGSVHHDETCVKSVLPLEVPSPWAVPEGRRRFEYEIGAELQPDMRGAGDWLDARATLSAYAELAVQAAHCPVFELGARGGGFVEGGGAEPVGEQWASLCIDANPAPLFRFNHRLQWGARPVLSAPRIYFARPYTRESIDFTLRLFDFPLLGRWSMQLWDLHPEFIATRQSDGVAARYLLEVDAAFSFLHFHRREDDPRAPEAWFDLFAIRINFFDSSYQNGIGAGTFRFSPVRVGDIRLGEPWLRLDVDAGFAGGDIHDAKQRDEKNGAKTLVKLLTWAGSLRLRIQRPGGGGEVAYTRSLQPAMDQSLVVEDRLSGRATLLRDRFEISVSPFVARTVTWLPTGGSVQDVTGGGGLGLGRDLGHHLRFAVAAEVARSFYARLDGGDARPTLGVRLLGTLSARYGTL